MIYKVETNALIIISIVVSKPMLVSICYLRVPIYIPGSKILYLEYRNLST